MGKFKHGMNGTRMNSIWANMRGRCNCPTNKDYADYGGRGIKCCEEWNEFINFYNWSMENGYSDKLSLDRIDVDGNYEPSNCRWITMNEQQRNKRNNFRVEFKGKMMTAGEISKITGVSFSKIYTRARKGFNGEDLIADDFVAAYRKHCIDGKMYSKKEICEKYSINKNTFNTRLGRGWTIQEIVQGKRNEV